MIRKLMLVVAVLALASTAEAQVRMLCAGTHKFTMGDVGGIGKDGPFLRLLAAGKYYGGVNSEIVSAAFPMIDTVVRQVEAQLCHFTSNVGTREALQSISERGFRAANGAECLTFRAKLEERFPTVACLGAQLAWGPERVLIIFDPVKNYRVLELTPFDGVWFPDHEFLVVRK
jgi:hypothetical protein